MWDIDVNYLFFRNNFATPEKLKQKLIESYGTYAYSCQCSWQNISDDYVPALKVSNWVCGGHKIISFIDLESLPWTVGSL